MSGLVLVLFMTTATVAGASSMSPKDFKRTANSICRQGTMLRDDLAQKHFGALASGEKPTAAQLQTFVAEYQPIVQQQIDSLRALSPPSTMKPKLTRMLRAAKATLRRVVADPSLLLGSTDPFAAVSSQAAALGLDRCAT